MLKDFMTEYRQKLCTPEEAVEVVKSGDWVDYTSSLGKPVLLDKALAKRRDELFDVKIRGNLVEGRIGFLYACQSLHSLGRGGTDEYRF